MSWATPPTFTSGDTLTAANMTKISDDLNETAPAKVTTKGDLAVATGANALTRVPVGTNGTRLAADSVQTSGVGWEFPYSALLSRASNKSISTATATLIDFDGSNGPGGGTSEIFDAFNWHSNSSNNTRLTVSQKGFYMIGAFATFASSAAGAQRYIAVWIDGTEYMSQGTTALPASGLVRLALTVPAVIQAGSYVELKVYQDSGGSINCTNAALWVVREHVYGV